MEWVRTKIEQFRIWFARRVVLRNMGAEVVRAVDYQGVRHHALYLRRYVDVSGALRDPRRVHAERHITRRCDQIVRFARRYEVEEASPLVHLVDLAETERRVLDDYYGADYGADPAAA